MDNRFENVFRKFSNSEIFYKSVYEQCPDAYISPIVSWEEFISCMPCEIKLPKEAPSPIMDLLVECDWFQNRKLDVAIVKNERYCPPFWHRLEFIKIVYVAEGSAELFVEDKKLIIEKGNLCIVLPNIENAVFSHNDEDIVINIIVKRSTFENAFYSILSEDTSLSDFFWQMLYNKNSNKVLPFVRKGEDNITEYIYALYRELSLGENASNIIVKSYVMLIFGLILRLYLRDEKVLGEVSEQNERAVDILRVIKGEMADITLPELAKKMKLSEGYLSRFIKNETGFTFRELLKKMRIHKAAEMLVNSSYSIEEIVSVVGYTDISRFYRNFKERFGVTPSVYRNSIRS